MRLPATDPVSQLREATTPLGRATAFGRLIRCGIPAPDGVPAISAGESATAVEAFRVKCQRLADRISIHRRSFTEPAEADPDYVLLPGEVREPWEPDIIGIQHAADDIVAGILDCWYAAAALGDVVADDYAALDAAARAAMGDLTVCSSALLNGEYRWFERGQPLHWLLDGTLDVLARRQMDEADASVEDMRRKMPPPGPVEFGE